MNEELLQLLKNCHAVKFGNFTLASGKKSNYYCDIKKATNNPVILELIAKKIVEIINNQVICAKAIGGVAIGGAIISTAVSLRSGLPMVIIRKPSKEYGLGGRIIGDVQGRNLLVIEDITTTASEVINAIKLLREEGALVDTVITIVDIDEGVSEALEVIGVKLIPLVKLVDFLDRNT